MGIDIIITAIVSALGALKAPVISEITKKIIGDSYDAIKNAIKKSLDKEKDNNDIIKAIENVENRLSPENILELEDKMNIKAKNIESIGYELINMSNNIFDNFLESREERTEEIVRYMRKLERSPNKLENLIIKRC